MHPTAAGRQPPAGRPSPRSFGEPLLPRPQSLKAWKSTSPS